MRYTTIIKLSKQVATNEEWMLSVFPRLIKSGEKKLKGFKIVGREIMFGEDSEDFMRNIISARITSIAYKVPRFCQSKTRRIKKAMNKIMVIR